MYWFAGTDIAQQIINTEKLPVLSKKSMVTKGFSINYLPQHQTIY